jgi:hypothetical protein
VHRGKNLLVAPEVAALLDPICRAEITRMRSADPLWGRLLDHLAAAGPASVEDLPRELGLKRQERELSRWFSWQWYWTGSLVDDLVTAGRLRRVDGFVAVPALAEPGQ